ncbi:MAG: hypothetical protein U1B79_00300 [Candidatus Pacearchaeota archaeon]|nr:hypothetical protein [Candidatus Pacearchaeota archaeon]
MKINRVEFCKALEIVKPGLANKELIEQSTSFAFIKDHVVTYNEEISVSHPVTGLEIEGAVKADELYQLLTKLKGDEIEMILDENEVRIISGKMKAGLIFISKIKLPLKSLGEIGKWKTLPKNFVSAIEFTAPSANKDSTRPVLTCIHFKGKTVEASDGYRIASYQLDETLPVKEFLMRSPAAKEIVKMNPVKIAEGEKWIHFQTEAKTILSCRIVSDDFPDTKNQMIVEGKDLTFPKTINAILDKASVFANRKHRLEEFVKITLEKDLVLVESTSDSGWFKEEAHMRYKYDKRQFFITPYLLKGILEESCVGVLGDNRIKFVGSNWTYVALLRENE